MNKKLATILLAVLAVCFLLLGVIFKNTAEKQRGVAVSTGAIINGNVSTISSGRIGANQEKYAIFNKVGTYFYVFAGISGLICIITVVSNKRD